MICPKCLKGFEPQFNPRQGTHNEQRYECAQLLQWDAEVRVRRGEAVTIGPPKPCSHTDVRVDDALTPLV